MHMRGTVNTSMAVTMTRLRPSTSATVPANGAISATASVLMVTMYDTSAALAPNSAVSSGRIGCGEYRLLYSCCLRGSGRRIAQGLAR